MIKVKFDKASDMMRVDESLEFADETAFVRWLEDVSDTGGDPRDGRAAGFSVIVTYIAYDFGASDGVHEWSVTLYDDYME